jgi:hypothetical protein
MGNRVSAFNAMVSQPNSARNVIIHDDKYYRRVCVCEYLYYIYRNIYTYFDTYCAES